MGTKIFFAKEAKPAYLYKQSAAIPFFIENGITMVVLITNKKRTKWLFPKGFIEYNTTPEESAANEAIEEAGVDGHIHDQCIAEYSYEKWRGVCSVKVFPLFVTELFDTWEEMGERDRLVVEIPEAIELVRIEQRDALKTFGTLDKSEFLP